jgi:hypothetical protein
VLEDWSGKDWQKNMANDWGYLNYNLEIKDETQLIYKKLKLKSHE